MTKPNLLLFHRLLTDGREKWSPFNKYENTGTLSRVQTTHNTYKLFVGKSLFVFNIVKHV